MWKIVGGVVVAGVAVVIALPFLFIMTVSAATVEAEAQTSETATVAGVVIGSCAPDCKGVNGRQGSFSVQAALDHAMSELGRQFNTGWGQPGECIVSVQRWINGAGGTFNPGGARGGYLQSGAVEVTDGSLRPGDVVQFESLLVPNAFLGGVHTYMVLSVNPNGTHDLIESNYLPPFQGVVGVRKNQELSPPPGFRAVVWRFATEPDT